MLQKKEQRNNREHRMGERAGDSSIIFNYFSCTEQHSHHFAINFQVGELRVCTIKFWEVKKPVQRHTIRERANPRPNSSNTVSMKQSSFTPMAGDDDYWLWLVGYANIEEALLRCSHEKMGCLCLDCSTLSHDFGHVSILFCVVSVILPWNKKYNICRKK